MQTSPRNESEAAAERPDYVRLLDDFGASHKAARECVRFLEQAGYSHGQARNAVYRFRRLRGITKRVT
jgi:hypothetical protein